MLQTGIHNTSEIGRLKRVLLHRPGPELENLMPEYLERLLFDDIPYLREAQREHDAFAACLRQQGVEVVYLADLAAESLVNSEVRQAFIREFLDEANLREERLRDRGHAVIVAAEGAGQHLLEHNAGTDASGNPVLGEIADLLRKEIHRYLNDRGMEHSIKYIDPSYIIRSVPANANDKVYCGFLGQYAVHAAMAGRTDMVVAKLQDRYVHLPLELVTRTRRKLNIYSDLWRAVLESTGQGMLKGMLPPE